MATKTLLASVLTLASLTLGCSDDQFTDAELRAEASSIVAAHAVLDEYMLYLSSPQMTDTGAADQWLLIDERFRQSIGPHGEIGSVSHLPSEVAEPMSAYKFAVHEARAAVEEVARIAIAVANGDQSSLFEYPKAHSRAKSALSKASAAKAVATSSARVYGE